jgi:hypothetical protein
VKLELQFSFCTVKNYAERILLIFNTLRRVKAKNNKNRLKKSFFSGNAAIFAPFFAAAFGGSSLFWCAPKEKENPAKARL